MLLPTFLNFDSFLNLCSKRVCSSAAFWSAHIQLFRVSLGHHWGCRCAKPRNTNQGFG